jgi:hypothetical protein
MFSNNSLSTLCTSHICATCLALLMFLGFIVLVIFSKYYKLDSPLLCSVFYPNITFSVLDALFSWHNKVTKQL